MYSLQLRKPFSSDSIFSSTSYSFFLLADVSTTLIEIFCQQWDEEHTCDSQLTLCLVGSCPFPASQSMSGEPWFQSSQLPCQPGISQFNETLENILTSSPSGSSMQEVKKLVEVISPEQSFLILSTKEAHVKYLGEVISPAQSFLISANCFKSRFVSSASLICARAASRLTTVVFLVSSLFTLGA